MLRDENLKFTAKSAISRHSIEETHKKETHRHARQDGDALVFQSAPWLEAAHSCQKTAVLTARWQGIGEKAGSCVHEGVVGDFWTCSYMNEGSRVATNQGGNCAFQF